MDLLYGHTTLVAFPKLEGDFRGHRGDLLHVTIVWSGTPSATIATIPNLALFGICLYITWGSVCENFRIGQYVHMFQGGVEGTLAGEFESQLTSEISRRDCWDFAFAMFVELLHKM